jgi:hypothetical protein
VPILVAGLIVVVLFMLALAVAPVIAAVSLLYRLTSKRAAPAKPTPAERLLRRPLSTGALVGWLVIPLLVIGLWATADALTEDGGSPPPPVPAQPPLKADGLPGLWKTSSGARVIFEADGDFTENHLPNRPPDDVGSGDPHVPRSATGTWQLEGSRAGYQYVELAFSPSTVLELTVLWQPVTDGHGYFVLQPYLGSSADLDPAYELIRQGGA